MTSARRTSRTLLFAAAVCLSVAVFPGQETPRAGGTLRIRPFDASVRPNLDPASGSWILATEQIFDGLIAIDSGLGPTPALAEYWRAEDDGRRTVFLLRKGVRFHNGRELDADDVKFSFERLLRPDTGSPFADLLAARVAGAREFREGKAAEVTGFRAPARDVFEIEWTAADLSGLSLLGTSFAKVLPRDLVLDQGRNFFWRPVGTGAFSFESWMRSPRLDIVGVRLDRNPRYFSKKPYVNVLEISPYFNEEHFRNRELDILPFLSEELMQAGCRVLSSGPQALTLLAMTCGLAPLDRPSVRRAIAQALDKDALAGTSQESALVSRATNNLIPPQWPGFYPRDAAPSSPDASRRTLEEQGFFFDREFPTLLFYVPGGRANAGQLRFAREAGRQLGRIGIFITVKTYDDLSELKDLKQPALIKIDRALDFPDPAAVLRPLFHSRSGMNRSVPGYANPDLDRLLDESAAEKSPGRRTDLFRKAETILIADMPAVPVSMIEQRIALQPYVRGVRVPPLGFAYLDAKEIWLNKQEENK